MQDIIQGIFNVYINYLPEDWSLLRFFHKTEGQGISLTFETYETTSKLGKEQYFEDPLEPEDSNSIRLLSYSLRDAISPDGLPKYTHIELTIHRDGTFDTVMGYGPVDWSPSSYPWPDDITAEEYTYKRAWPDGKPDFLKD
ncbi:MAG: hypothetical protein R3B94_09820 [Hyphomonas sp.]